MLSAMLTLLSGCQGSYRKGVVQHWGGEEGGAGGGGGGRGHQWSGDVGVGGAAGGIRRNRR